MVFKPTLNITEQIADHLAQLVIRDELPGGSRIQELKIANQLGVSRGSVREALLILERRQLIEIVPRKGAVVNEIDSGEVLDLVDMLQAAEQRLMPLFIHDPRARERLPEAATHLRSMERGARQGALDDVLDARSQFYALLLTTGSRYLQAVFESLLPSSQRLMRRLALKTEVDLHDIPRYYNALFHALDVKDEERLTELLNAFYKRLRGLCPRAGNANEKMPRALKKMAFS